MRFGEQAKVLSDRSKPREKRVEAHTPQRILMPYGPSPALATRSETADHYREIRSGG